MPRPGRYLLVGALLASTVAGHVAYPAAVAALARRTPRPAPAEPATWPSLTVVVPAYLEAGVIADKVENIRANDYPGELDILVVADGDPATAAVAEAAGARVLLIPERGGKSQALNAGLAAATGEVVVLTDANAQMEPGALVALARWFSDPEVGAVAGEKHEGTGGELSYWKFSSWIKSSEAALGATNMDGSLCAVRRSVWRDIPADISCDDYWISLDIAERGHRVGYDPEAIVREESIGSLKLSWERRTRVLGSALYVIWKKKHLLDPRRGQISANVWGHKLWRSTLGPLSHLALFVLALGGLRTSNIARLFVVGNVVAVVALLRETSGHSVPKLLRIPAQVIYLQAVAFGGMLRFLQGDRAVRWKKPSR